MSTPEISIVVPLFNEQEVVDELISRCLAAIDTLGRHAEVVVVDDGSSDATAERLSRWQAQDSRVVALVLPKNVGQFRATLAGLRHARGPMTVTMDGDLQDPPELIPQLVQALTQRPDVDVVFAVKQSRDDPYWVQVGALGYTMLQRLLSPGGWPGSVGSFAAMPAATVKQLLGSTQEHANLAAVLLSVRVRFATVHYARSARAHGTSRVGAWGLVREALGSLSASGAALWGRRRR